MCLKVNLYFRNSHLQAIDYIQIEGFQGTTLCLKKVITLIINNIYKLEPILIILGTLYAETTGF